jgi:hypothetical protein
MKTALQIGLTALLVGALAFYGGVMYGRSSGRSGLGGAAGFAARGGAAGGNAANAARFRGGAAAGDVISADAKSITVKSADGSTKTVYFDAATRVLHSSEATLTDLIKGATVIAAGTPGSDGSITARSVQIVPKGTDLATFGGMRGGFGGGGAGGGQGAGQGAPGGGFGGAGAAGAGAQ